jgi:hypothetical protein
MESYKSSPDGGAKMRGKNKLSMDELGRQYAE